MDQPPVLIEVDGPVPDAKSLEADLGRQRFGAHLRVEQDAFVPRPGRPGGLAVPKVREELVQVVGMQLAGARVASARS